MVAGGESEANTPGPLFIDRTVDHVVVAETGHSLCWVFSNRGTPTCAAHYPG
ncbi:hypothetical protein Poly41_07590 [Novipirellula artificiosorum]|uniref:Uncharacterized protein n=1 Tax=Novipirellula artificiosorum TaxID=2528016 RepID=A0A5C6E0Q1_9BACT|nr:hypothetical protein Poly41_07590 [Novipirellula artificiosorum]